MSDERTIQNEAPNQLNQFFGSIIGAITREVVTTIHQQGLLPMDNYSRSFRALPEDIIQITRDYGPKISSSRLDNPEKEVYVREWLDRVSGILGINSPRVVFKYDAGDRTGAYGTYNYQDNCITLFRRISLVTLIHEFRHCMQHQIKGLNIYMGSIEHDARGWSMSLFRAALPKSWKKAIDSDKVAYR